MEKLKHQLAEAEAAVEARKKPPPETGPRVRGEGLVIDEWVCVFYLIMYLFNLLVFSTHYNFFSFCTIFFFSERAERKIFGSATG